MSTQTQSDGGPLAERHALRVLLVEDDQIDQMAFRRAVERENLGYEVSIVTSLAEAKEALGTRTFDVIVTDYMLGDGRAFDVSEAAPGVPWIIVTGAGDETLAVAALRAGAQDYIVKRTDRNHLKLLPFAIGAAVKLARAGERVLMLSQAMKSVVDAVYITDLGGNFLFANAAFGRMYGYDEDALVGLEVGILSAEGPPDAVDHIEDVQAGWVGEVVHQSKSGTTMPVWLTRSSVVNEHGVVSALVHVARDMTERRRMEDALRSTNEQLSRANAELELSRRTLAELAIRDELTGLYNRRELKRLLDDEVLRSARTKSPLSLILLDADHFKRVNDEHGHLAGDEVLRELSRIIMRAIRRIDRAARFGGEEMAVLLPDTAAPDAIVVGERIRQIIAATMFDVTGPGGTTKQVFMTASLGVATLNDDIRTGQALIHRADQALYHAKGAGRNQTSCLDAVARPRTASSSVPVPTV